ncbi:MAG TPA: MATE family efflux transporter [Planctomycetota bacterium]|nr:MATE family efflux transporter [Planctomycetota bacterium]
MGIIATVARAVGEGDVAKQRRTAAAAGLLVVMGLGGVASAAGITVPPMLTVLFEVPDNPRVVDLAAWYTRITGARFFFNLLMIGSGAVMRAAGKTRTPMMIGLAANAINIRLDYALIFGHFGLPKMGVVGAAVAMAAAQGFYGLCAFSLLPTRFGGIRLRPGVFREVTRDSFRSLGRVTGPAVLEPIVMQIGFLTYSIIVAALGQTQLAAHRAGIAIESLVFMPGNAIAIA